MEELSRCPYLDICKCPNLGWVPEKGFKQVPEGILCLNWNVVITHNQLSLLMRKEGRHIAGIDSADKIDITRKKYSRSDKRKAAQKRYAGSDKGQAVIEKHSKGEKAKLTRQKYYYSDKGQEAHERSREKRKLFREYSRWLVSHPGKSLSDFLKEQGSERN